jgi:transcriptional regulator with XRE-family HTH domain
MSNHAAPQGLLALDRGLPPPRLWLSDPATIQPSIASRGRLHAGASLMPGRILRQLRESKGRSQADVARSAGISPAQLARLEANQRGLYVEDFVNIAAVLGEKPGNLLPNDLGDIAHLKPLIDRLATIRPEVLPRVAAIIEGIVMLTEGVTSELPSPKKRKKRRSITGSDTRESTRGRSITT